MAFRGKLSRGCQMCLARRIKCDETRPKCTHCLRTGRVCPGYRDEIDLVLRDETERTRQKAKGVVDRKAGKQKKGVEANIVAALSSCAQRGPADVVAIQQPLEELAFCHFVSNYMLLPEPGKFMGFMDFVMPLLKTGKAPLYYQCAFEACALASLNNSVGHRNHFEQLALGKCTKALSAISIALRNPEVAEEDSTLATILLFALFEFITAKAVGRLAASRQAVGTHIAGAMQLVKLRGRKQVKTQLGLDMLITVRMHMVIHGLTSSKIPHIDVSLWTEDACKDSGVAQGQTLCIKVDGARTFQITFNTSQSFQQTKSHVGTI
ncbi:hypothetical protein QQS21_001968 [Conoideocrella luteorostrata]|uniref:Zn(2)-C6 fungal-type domain-containing protein n=1 Tax=Conoideocrella luteorostrata TaxID=1105319 RepID=A0AAJ0CWY1_9HYPO|nr:hypothetical protein QQS21_001968 [Conoideocrella luteorostrata]